MPLADSNIWLAIALSKHEFHAAVKAWLRQRTSGEPLCFCRSTQQSFLRLLTTEAVLKQFGTPALTNVAAWKTYEEIIADKRFGWLDEPAGLDVHWKKWCRGPRPSPKLWMDAYLAAFAMEGGHQFVTTDKGFKQFKGLNLVVLPHE